MTTRTSARAYETEAGFQRAVVDLARLYGWRCYHTWRSIHSPSGFPDLVLVRTPRVIFAELKRERGRLSPLQEAWLCDLRECQGVETYEWRPSQWSEVVDVLQRKEV